MYFKIRFTSKNNGNTASLIVSQAQIQDKSLSTISDMFPMSEAMKMERFERGPGFETWEQAFAHDINGDPL